MVSRRRRSTPQNTINKLIAIMGKEHSEIIGDFSTVVTDFRRTISRNHINNHNENGNNIRQNMYTKVGAFRDNLLRHENYENEVLIPSMRDVLPEAGEHLDKCIDDHKMLEKLVDGLWTSSQERKNGEFDYSARQLLSALLKHFDDEDNLCIPLLTGLNGKQRDAFVGRIGKVGDGRLGEG